MKRGKSTPKLSNSNHIKKNKSLNSLYFNNYSNERSGLSSTVLNYVNKRLNELKLEPTNINQDEPKMLSCKSTTQIKPSLIDRPLSNTVNSRKTPSTKSNVLPNSYNRNTKPLFRESKGANSKTEMLQLKEENAQLNQEIISYQVKIKMLQEEIKKLNVLKQQKNAYEKYIKNENTKNNDDIGNTIQTLSVSITDDNIDNNNLK